MAEIRGIRREQLGLIILTVCLVLSRLVPHPPNLSIVGATALLAGAFIGSLGLSLFSVLLGLIISDLSLGFYSSAWATYLGFAMVVLLGWMVRKRRSFYFVVPTMALGSLIFYLVSNLGVWWSTPLYTKDLGGLLQCFLLALPFFENTLVSDLLSVIVGLFAYELVRQNLAKEVSDAR